MFEENGQDNGKKKTHTGKRSKKEIINRKRSRKTISKKQMKAKATKGGIKKRKNDQKRKKNNENNKKKQKQKEKKILKQIGLETAPTKLTMLQVRCVEMAINVALEKCGEKQLESVDMSLIDG